tara:strand:- start:195 stop:845 length:651 start_codon:yes stop_codon:yes gene_type:complete
VPTKVQILPPAVIINYINQNHSNNNMKRGIILFMIIISLFIPACAYRYDEMRPVACTMEGLVCPDGTVVGRVGPNCEFKKCPEIETPSEPPKQKTLIPTEKHETYEECFTEWEEALENKELLEIKSNKVIIKFKEDIKINDAMILMKSYELDPEIHMIPFPGVTLEESYDLLQMLEAEVEPGKELHFICEIEKNEEVIQAFPDIELKLFKELENLQ